MGADGAARDFGRRLDPACKSVAPVSRAGDLSRRGGGERDCRSAARARPVGLSERARASPSPQRALTEEQQRRRPKDRPLLLAFEHQSNPGRVCRVVETPPRAFLSWLRASRAGSAPRSAPPIRVAPCASPLPPHKTHLARPATRQSSVRGTGQECPLHPQPGKFAILCAAVPRGRRCCAVFNESPPTRPSRFFP